MPGCLYYMPITISNNFVLIKLQSHSRPLNIAESCSFNLNSWVTLKCLGSHFAANMLPFAITIGPYEKSLGASCLSLNILCDSFLILYKFVSGTASAKEEDQSTSAIASLTRASKNRLSGGGWVQLW